MMIRTMVVLASGAVLAGCSTSSFSIPGFGSSSGSGSSALSEPVGTGAATVRVESEPPGAEARTAGGAACRTPCTMSLPAGGSVVSFSLNGYLPQSIPVRVNGARETWDEADAGAPPTVSIDPDPVYAMLEPAPPPPPPPKKKPAPRRPAAAAAAASKPASAPPPQPQAPPGFGTAPPPPAFGPAPPPPVFR